MGLALRAESAPLLHPPWPPPPFTAWVGVESAYVYAQPRTDAALLGLVHEGAVLRVVECLPSCDAPNAWAQLESNGAIKLALLRQVPASLGNAESSSVTDFQYGRIIRSRWPAYAKPNTTSPVRGVFKAGQELAFRALAADVPSGWLRRLDGSYMQKAGVHPLVPSAFAGEWNPTLPLGFVIRQSALRKDNGEVLPVSRYQRLPVFLDLPSPKGMVRTADGFLPRSAVRLVTPHPRPPQIPADARWVHVNRPEQTLTAYEGDHMVFATLISTGKSETPTPAGLYQISYKALQDSMHGEPDDPYLVEEVPFVMFFLHGMGLHGTYWHDRFGSEVSHGCVNLSLADARWLFDWAPPPLPLGWQGIFPMASAGPALFVLVR